MHVEIVASGLGLVEGPVITQAGAVVCTAVDTGLVHIATPTGTTVLADVGGGANGAAEGADGRIYVAQNGGRWAANRPEFRFGMSGGVQAIDRRGDVAWVTMDPVAPNDLCFGRDAFLYLTDPTYRPARDDGRLWRVDPVTGDTELLCSVSWFPNGIAFGLDDRLYVASTGDASVIRYEIDERGLSDPEVVFKLPYGHPDGLAFDEEGNLIVAALSDGHGPGEIQTWSSDGTLLDRYRPGASLYYTNIALSVDRRLFVTDASRGQLLCVHNWPVGGFPLHPFRASPNVMD